MKKIVQIGMILLLAAALAACVDQKEPTVSETAAATSAVETEPEVTAASSVEATEPEAEERNAVFTDFTALDLDGNAVNQDIFAGSKLTMINIWGTFCGPCIREMPDLGELNREFEEKGAQIIGIVMDVTDRNVEPVQEMVNTAKQIVTATGADYRHLIPSMSLMMDYLYTVQYIPQTIFVNQQGYQVGQTIVGSRDKAEWAQIITELLETVE